MLGKLLKYEIPAMGRKLLPLYAAWAATALILGLTAQMAESKSEFLVAMAGVLYFVIAIAILVMTVILIIQRYNNSLLGDEAYFNQVLPVTTSEHIGNKLISAIIWIFITILVAIITGLLIALGAIIAGGSDVLDPTKININIALPKHFWLYFIEVVILVVASAAKTVMQIFTAITIGHQAQNHTTLASIGAYILVLMFEATVGRMAAPLILLSAGNAPESITVGDVFIPGLIVTAFFLVVYFFACKILMEKKLNLA